MKNGSMAVKELGWSYTNNSTKQQQPNILATKIDRKIYCIVEKSNMAAIISNMAAPIF